MFIWENSYDSYSNTFKGNTFLGICSILRHHLRFFIVFWTLNILVVNPIIFTFSIFSPTLSHHRLKQNNTTCCHFTQKLCFHSALFWQLSGSLAKGPLSAFKRGYFFNYFCFAPKVTELSDKWRKQHCLLKCQEGTHWKHFTTTKELPFFLQNSWAASKLVLSRTVEKL